MFKRTCHPPCFAWFAILVAGSTALGASPQLSRILPRGGQRGTEVTLSFTGNRLADAQEVLVYEPGITITKIEQPEKGQAGRQVKVTVKIAPDARLGEYGMRLRTASGISDYRTFWVGPFPTVVSGKDHFDFKHPQQIPLNVTVEGVVENERVDYYVVEAKKGQRISAEIEGMRLGNAMFDPYVAILDENRFELSASDDTVLNKQDSVASIAAPKDGRYIIQVRDSAFGGSGDSHYRLHVGTFPRPIVAYPLGGQAGQTVALQFLGDPKGPVARSISLPDKADEHFDLFCDENGLISPSPNHFRVCEFPNVLEAEPNDAIKTATAYAGPLPVAFNGIITGNSEGGDKAQQDADYWKFQAKKGQALDINVYARRLRSPLDPILTLHDANGRQIAINDDSGGPDSYLRFNVPADGSYFVRVRDHLRGAGPMHVYRIEITPVKASAALSIPQYTQQYTQERQAVTVARGNRYATLMRLTRQDAGGAMSLVMPDLPAGVKVETPGFENGVDTVPVLFEADANAAVSGKLVETKVSPVDPKGSPAKPHSQFRQIVELVHGPPNQTSYYQTTAERLALAVAQEAPFSLTIAEPKVPLVQGGQMNLKVIAKRAKDFTGPITLHFLYRPPGIEAASTIEIPANQSEAIYPINASDGAAARKWKIVVLGSADAGGTVWVSSPFANLEVAPPLLTAKIATSSVEQGQAVEISADLDVKARFEGKAKVELIGLPAGASAEAREISADEKKAEFELKTQKITPAASHNSLFLRVTVMKSGEPIVHNIARGGTVRVDLPPGAKPAPKTEAKAEAPAKPKKVNK